MFHLATYFADLAANAADSALSAIADSVFTTRNNSLIFTERYNMLGAAHLAVSATRSRFNVPRWNAFARMQIWPVNRSATPPSYPRIMDLRAYPAEIPVNEELQVEASNNLGAATENTTVHLWIGPPNWNMNFPRGEQRLTCRFTSAVARTADTWSGLGNITFAENLRGGWYAVVGAYVQSANLRAFRLHFPRNPVVNGRVLRPGHLVSNALGDLEPVFSKSGLGTWGIFNTFEPPMIEVYGDAAGADTQEGRFDLVYLGDTSGTAAPTGVL